MSVQQINLNSDKPNSDEILLEQSNGLDNIEEEEK